MKERGVFFRDNDVKEDTTGNQSRMDDYDNEIGMDRVGKDDLLRQMKKHFDREEDQEENKTTNTLDEEADENNK